MFDDAGSDPRAEGEDADARRRAMAAWLDRTSRRSVPVPATRAEVFAALDELRGPWPGDGA
jgi:hypothetical protein